LRAGKVPVPKGTRYGVAEAAGLVAAGALAAVEAAVGAAALAAGFAAALAAALAAGAPLAAADAPAPVVSRCSISSTSV